ncbi:MAG: hypothetical protein FJ267_19995 [Planctomycetes bacterium]|nr:hypothetical protein [Planctomycetota bacterium]
MTSAHLDPEKNKIYPHRACVGGIMPHSYTICPTYLVAIRQNPTEASSVGKRTCIALLSPSAAVQLDMVNQAPDAKLLYG